MSELNKFDEFMDALVNCDTVKVILTGCGESTFETKQIYEGICSFANRRAQPANEPKVVEIDQVKNEPLTLDELRGMDGEPVWVKEITPEPIDGDYWGLVDPDFVCVDGYGVGAVLSTATDGKSRFAQTPLSDYGKTWLAYRRKPEGSENDA